ncbi:probable xyloglucan glycosyltransferase 7 [Phragmites australis]|uniref:probable xyloglucan glycosyltransferase 7 n=1 Tax=Phragmites australis TaxID=29695 RepID=UPI002D79B459|nr:probable xyloglucan glycosyltransferase 7 [Phragmites australis]
MLRRGCIPDVVTYTILLEATCKRRGYKQALKLLDVPQLIAMDGIFAAAAEGWMRIRLKYLAPPPQFFSVVLVQILMYSEREARIREGAEKIAGSTMLEEAVHV